MIVSLVMKMRFKQPNQKMRTIEYLQQLRDDDHEPTIEFSVEELAIEERKSVTETLLQDLNNPDAVEQA